MFNSINNSTNKFVYPLTKRIKNGCIKFSAFVVVFESDIWSGIGKHCWSKIDD